jgi:hypothetical protein
MPQGSLTRRRALARLTRLAAGLAMAPGLRLGTRRVEHPEPRAGITAANVLPPGRVPPGARRAYEAARTIPQVLDGLYCHCHCDCARRDGLRSLLGCFETEMPTTCGICTGEAELALELHRRGRTLDEVRDEIDTRFG